MKEPQRYHAQNPLDLEARPGIMFPGDDGPWVRFEEHRQLVGEMEETIRGLNERIRTANELIYRDHPLIDPLKGLL